MSEEIDTNKMFREEFKALRNDYIELQQENTQLKSVLKEIREFIEVEKEAGILWTERSTNVLLEIIDKGIGE